MRIAILADMHGNVTAFDAVLAEMDRDGPFDEVLVGGDIAYGGPFPRECLEHVRERGYRSVYGNTDEMLIGIADGDTDPQGRWVIDQLDHAQIELLRSMPMSLAVGTDDQTLTLVHATPWSVWESVFPSDPDEPYENMLAETDASAVAYGHIHLQHQRNLANGVVIAVGSVGRPFDGDQRAMYTVVEASSRGWNIAFRRVAYDVEKAIADSRNCGSPNGEAFADSLVTATRPH